jgi:hypothetical protein
MAGGLAHATARARSEPLGPNSGGRHDGLSSQGLWGSVMPGAENHDLSRGTRLSFSCDARGAEKPR